MSKTYKIIAYSAGGHRVTFKMHNDPNSPRDDNTIAQAAESRLRSYGIPKHLCTIERITP